MKKIGILQFPGGKCDRDVFQALKLKGAEFLPAHRPLDTRHYRAFVLPGGFSYGDYLRPGALAAFSPALRDLTRAVQKGCPVLGICNGFQILCEAGLLPGALLPNHSGRFIDGWMALDLCADTSFWPAGKKALRLPIAHAQGAYYASQDILKKLEDQNQIWMRYRENPKGSTGGIARLTSYKGWVAGLMPHPERAVSDEIGGTDGLSFFANI